MFEDTICAPSTPPVHSSIAVVRMSGPDTFSILSASFSRPAGLGPRRAVFGSIVDGDARIDDVVAVFYRAPDSFTGEDMAEVSCHGNPIIVKNIMGLFIRRGARPAGPGEFSRRAFLNGKMDLTAAEAINHIVRARGEREIQASLEQMHGSLRDRIRGLRERLVRLKGDVECGIDFVEEDIELLSAGETAVELDKIAVDLRDILGRCRAGERVVRGVDLPIVGKPNVGKSSILNAILNAERAIVSEIPGTTRDLIRETVQFAGIHVDLFDTAGIDTPACLVEEKGIDLSRKKIDDAMMLIFVVDAARGIDGADLKILSMVRGKTCFVLANKIDLVPEPERLGITEFFKKELGMEVLPFSALTGQGMKELEVMVETRLREDFVECGVFFIADLRITSLLESAIASAESARALVEAAEPPEIIAFEMQGLLESLGEITGEISPDEVLNSIFGRFCIGK